MTTATDKIIIVSGQEFRVPADTDNEAIRNQLRANFPDVGNATIQTGTKSIDGVEYQTVEFVKKAGTKGTDEHIGLVIWLDKDMPRHGSYLDKVTKAITKANPYDWNVDDDSEDSDRVFWRVFGPIDDICEVERCLNRFAPKAGYDRF